MAAAAQERIEYEHNERVWLAWNTAAFMRVKRMTEADRARLLIKRRDKRRSQTWIEQRDIARIITLANGGKVN